MRREGLPDCCQAAVVTREAGAAPQPHLCADCSGRVLGPWEEAGRALASADGAGGWEAPGGVVRAVAALPKAGRLSEGVSLLRVSPQAGHRRGREQANVCMEGPWPPPCSRIPRSPPQNARCARALKPTHYLCELTRLGSFLGPGMGPRARGPRWAQGIWGAASYPRELPGALRAAGLTLGSVRRKRSRRLVQGQGWPRSPPAD